MRLTWAHASLKFPISYPHLLFLTCPQASLTAVGWRGVRFLLRWGSLLAVCGFELDLIVGLAYTQLSVIGKGGEREETVAFGLGSTLAEVLLRL